MVIKSYRQINNNGFKEVNLASDTNNMKEQAAYDDQIFEKLAYTDASIFNKEFQSCTFRNCDFSKSNFSRNKFLDCTFEECNLSMTGLDGSTLNDVVFKNCKLLAVNFSKCDDFLFSAGFDGCILDYASFMGKKLIKTRFRKCSLKEVSFTQANLTGSVFDDSGLYEAVFNGTDLTSVNFVTAYNFIIDPELNTLKKASFSANGLPNLLTRHQIKVV